MELEGCEQGCRRVCTIGCGDVRTDVLRRGLRLV